MEIGLAFWSNTLSRRTLLKIGCERAMQAILNPDVCAIFIAAGGLCLGVTVVEWRHGTTPLAGTAAAHRGARWTLLEHEGFGAAQPPARCREETRQAMASSIATLLTRNLHDVFGENDPARRRAAIDELFTEDGVFYDPSGGVYRGRDATRSIASRARSGRRTRTFAISPSPSPRKWAMAGGSNGSKAARVRRQRTPGRISSLPGTAGLPLCISFSTRSPELDAAARRPPVGE